MDNLEDRLNKLQTNTVCMSVPPSEVDSNNGSAKNGKCLILRKHWIQCSSLTLVTIMTICILAMTILYILSYQW